MNRNLILFLVLVIAIIAGFAFANQKTIIGKNNQANSPTPSPTSAKVIFPAGNETLSRGEKYLLRWNAQGKGKIQVSLINNTLESQGESVSISDKISDVDDRGSFAYTIPANIETGTYKFRIGQLTSNIFQIIDNHAAIVPFCRESDLKTALTLEGAAGSTYGNLSIKNISANICKIAGDNFIKAKYSVTNVKVKKQQNEGAPIINLSPNQLVYSEIRYPNGPQCSESQTSTASFSYEISPNVELVFKNQNGDSDQNITVCKSASEITNIDVWSISSTPAN